jgi:hypothetical protein
MLMLRGMVASAMLGQPFLDRPTLYHFAADARRLQKEVRVL